MNYIYRSNRHTFLVAFRTEGIDKDPNEMTHFERVASYYCMPVDLGDFGSCIAFLPPNLQEEEQIFDKEGTFYDGVYILRGHQLMMALNDELALLHELPDVFHNIPSESYTKTMEMYTAPFEFIDQLNAKLIRSIKAADLIADKFLKLMDGFSDAVVCYYINEHNGKIGSVEKPLSFIPRRRGVVPNDPIIFH
jgi:hypothetical protein